MPLMMEASGLIDALIGVCTEIVALCLDEVRIAAYSFFRPFLRGGYTFQPFVDIINPVGKCE